MIARIISTNFLNENSSSLSPVHFLRLSMGSWTMISRYSLSQLLTAITGGNGCQTAGYSQNQITKKTDTINFFLDDAEKHHHIFTLRKLWVVLIVIPNHICSSKAIPGVTYSRLPYLGSTLLKQKNILIPTFL